MGWPWKSTANERHVMGSAMKYLMGQPMPLWHTSSTCTVAPAQNTSSDPVPVYAHKWKVCTCQFNRAVYTVTPSRGGFCWGLATPSVYACTLDASHRKHRRKPSDTWRLT